MDNYMRKILQNFNNVGNKKVITECGDMPQQGISLQAGSASEMAALLKALANVDSAPAMDMPPAMGMEPKPAMGMEPNPAMDMPLKLPAPEMDMDTDEAFGDATTEPDEEYMDISAVLTTGDDVHKTKKSFKPTNGGDNPMALESIKDRLWAALNEKKSQ